MGDQAVLDHFGAPRNVGEIDEPDATGRAGNPVCGDEVRVTLRVEAGTVAALRYRAFGCHATIAAMSALSERVEGRPVAEVLALTPADVKSLFADFPPGKAHAAEVAIEAVRTALAAGGRSC